MRKSGREQPRMDESQVDEFCWRLETREILDKAVSSEDLVECDLGKPSEEGATFKRGDRTDPKPKRQEREIFTFESPKCS